MVIAVLIAFSPNAYTAGNSLAYFIIDSDLATAGYQGGSSLKDIGPGEYIGFAVYMKNYDDLGAYSVDVTWTGDAVLKNLGNAEFGKLYSTNSIMSVPSYTINGVTGAIEAEDSIFPSFLDIVSVDTADQYTISISSDGDAAVSTGYGMAYFVVFKTSSSFTTDDSVMIKIDVDVVNGDGTIEKALGYRYFSVNGATDVKTSTWGEVKSKFKD